MEPDNSIILKRTGKTSLTEAAGLKVKSIQIHDSENSSESCKELLTLVLRFFNDEDDKINVSYLEFRKLTQRPILILESRNEIIKHQYCEVNSGLEHIASTGNIHLYFWGS